MQQTPTSSPHGIRHEHHRWQEFGIAEHCEHCYVAAFEYAARRAQSLGVSGVWADDVAVRALEQAVDHYDISRRSRSEVPFRSFLVALLRNRAYDRLKSERARMQRGETWQLGQARLSAAAPQIDEFVANLDLVAEVVHRAHQKWGRDNPDIVAVLELWLLGEDTSAIARRIGRNPRTVRRHLEDIRDWLSSRFA